MAKRHTLTITLREDGDTIDFDSTEGMTVELATEMLEFALLSLRSWKQ